MIAKSVSADKGFEIALEICAVQWLRTGKTEQFQALASEYEADLSNAERAGLRADIEYLERNPDVVIDALADDHSADMAWFKAEAFMARNDAASARKLVELLVPALEEKIRLRPEEARYHSELGVRYAFLGRKDEAVRETRRAVELLPESKDAVDGSKMVGNVAYIYAQTGILVTPLN